MKQAYRKAFRNSLLTLKRRLGTEVSGLEQQVLRGTGGDASGSLSNFPVHPADLGTDNFEAELSLSLLERENEVLSQVNEALERMDEGTYGQCENCDRDIGRERLQAIPYARFCVECASTQ
jgi:RNA polymerase-binding protein DksA